jgi:hypothetical protein
VTRRVAEIDTLPATGPPDAAFDLDTALLQALFPFGQGFHLNGERQMDGALSIVRRDPATRNIGACGSRPASEHEQNSPPASVHRHEPLFGQQHAKPEHVAIERYDAFHIVYIQGTLEQAFH